jgi:hypothetical protein
MFCRVALSVLLCLTLTEVSGAAESLSNKALADAVNLLEARLKRMSKPEDVARVKKAIANLKSLAAEKSPAAESSVESTVPAEDPIEVNDDNLADFIDNTEKYKGKWITLEGDIESAVFLQKGTSLRDLVGGEVEIKKLKRGNGDARLDMRVSIPAGLDVPKSGYNDPLSIVFFCREGSLTVGNKAKSIRRGE